MFRTRKRFRPEIEKQEQPVFSYPVSISKPESAETSAPLPVSSIPPEPNIEKEHTTGILDVENVRETHRRAFSQEMSKFLKHGGNVRVWKEVATSILAHKTVILSGPHGCGKTAGIHDLATKHLGVLVYELSLDRQRVDSFSAMYDMSRAQKPYLDPGLF